MNLSFYEPWRLAAPMRRPLRADRPLRDAPEPARAWAPAVDIVETAEAYRIHADIPGVAPGDIEITMEKGVLTIRGERHRDATGTGASLKRAERPDGGFARSFSLPDSVDVDGISASSTHGVLKILIPKQERVRPRRVTVQH